MAPPIPLDESLRATVADRLGAHERIEMPLEGRRHAAVAIVLVESDEGDDEHDPHRFSDDGLVDVPGDTAGLDGQMIGVAGGASFVLCRRSAGLNPPIGLSLRASSMSSMYSA